jgi:hypothetical protein
MSILNRAWSWMAAVAMVCFALYLATPAHSYLGEVTQSDAQLKWNFAPGSFAVQWSLNPSTGSNITGGRSVADVIQSAFNTWTTAPNASIPVTRGPDSPKVANAEDGVNLISFTCSSCDFSKDAETLAVTFTTFRDASGQPDDHGGTTAFAGQLIDADILFNPNTKYATDSTGTGQDLQTVATHEIGHFLGMDHSGVVKAIMFPFAPALETTLSYDDVAGISQIYPKPAPDFATGSVSGAITHSGPGTPVFGAHVFADSTSAALPVPGNVRKSPIGALTRPDGTYMINGLPLDSYIITAEPLDGPEDSTNLTGGFLQAFSRGAVDTGFTTRWH